MEVMPRIARVRPGARFYIVGMNPSATVTALASRPGIVVTGTVPDMRPYIQHAAAVVAPLRVARGVQSKVLEAMAMARPVVVSPAARQGLRGEAGKEFAVATSAEEFSSDFVIAMYEFRGRFRDGTAGSVADSGRLCLGAKPLGVR